MDRVHQNMDRIHGLPYHGPGHGLGPWTPLSWSGYMDPLIMDRVHGPPYHGPPIFAS